MRRDLVADVAALCRQYGIEAMYVFGSRATEIARLIRSGQPVSREASSNVDVGVLPHPGVILDAHRKVKLMADLEDLLGVNRIDLVSLPETSAFLAVEIVQGALVYEADPDRSAEYDELYVLRRAGDLAPFERERIHRILAGIAM
jgi:predicted nucleotidyltransferase